MDYGHDRLEIEAFVSGFFKNEVVGNSTAPSGRRDAEKIEDASLRPIDPKRRSLAKNC
jgi:hypothetical protein